MGLFELKEQTKSDEENKDTPLEEDYYEPIRQALLQKFKHRGKCHIEITAKGISDEMKRVLPKDSVFMLLQERKKPDLIGHIENIKGTYKKTFIVEVKRDWLTFNGLYQTKLYADMLRASWAFLISPKGFNIEREEFLREHSYMLSYMAVNSQITPMKILENGDLEFIESLSSVNPFSGLE